MSKKQTKQQYWDHNNHNAKWEYREHNKTDTRQNHSIKAIEIQAGSKNKPRSSKFISFLLFVDKFGHFKWFITALLIKLDIIVDEKIRLRKLIKIIEILAGSNNMPRSSTFDNLLFLINKFSHFKWLTIAFLKKVDVVVDEKKKLQKLRNYWKRTPVIATVTVNSGYLNLSAFYCS